MISKRSEILFLYDVTNCNPNGDPLNDNMPRMDGDYCFVTDVSIKRKVRDYIMNFKNQEIFVKPIQKPDATLQTREERFSSFSGILDILEKCVDIRLFGGVFPIGKEKVKPEKPKKTKKTEEMQQTLLDEQEVETKQEQTTEQADADVEKKANRSSIHLTGPVQFQYGRSLHKISEPELVQITCVFPSKEDKQQGTFGYQQIVKYALIGVDGVVNENIVRIEHCELVRRIAQRETGLDKYLLSDEDVKLLIEALWKGVKNTISTSKYGHTPRLLIQIVYKEPDFYIGSLRNLLCIRLKNLTDERDIRTVDDYYLVLDKFIDKLKLYSSKIEQVSFIWDRDLRLLYGGSDFDLNKTKELIPVECNELSF